MSGVDRDLEEIIKFCKSFNSGYIEELKNNANRLKVLASSAQTSLGNTEFATDSSEKLLEAAGKMLKAAVTGEERIREIQRIAEQQLEELTRINGMGR